MHTIKLSIVIPHYNMNEGLERLLSSIYNSGIRRHLFEVIVVDNGSDIFPEHICRNVNTKLVSAPDYKSSYHARNVGVSLAKGDTILFIDADCTIDTNFIVESINYTGDKVLVCPMKDTFRSKLLTEAYTENNKILRFACVTIKKSLLKENPFSVHIKSGQDNDFCIKHGYEFSSCQGKHYLTFFGSVYRHIRYGTGVLRKDQPLLYTHYLTLMFFYLFTLRALVTTLTRIVDTDWTMKDALPRVIHPLVAHFYEIAYSIGRAIKPFKQLR